MRKSSAITLAGVLLLSDLVVLRAAPPEPDLQNAWTVMIYGGVDSTAESYLIPHLAAIKKESRAGLDGEVVLLMDRVDGASDDKKTLGKDFDDTRLFRLVPGGWERLVDSPEFPHRSPDSTYEANTGAPKTLQSFIRFAKREFPARRYALVLFGHGESRSLCPDVSSNCADSGEFEDPLFTAEITEGLTQREAVDVLWVDTCSFGGIENAYQFRPREDRFHAQVLLTAATLSAPAPIARVLRYCGIIRSDQERAVAGNATEFGKAALEAITDSLSERAPRKQRVERESWAAYDLQSARAVKESVDRLAVAIVDGNGRQVVEDIRGWGTTPSPTQGEGRGEGAATCMNYMYPTDPTRWVSSAHFDVYDLARRIRDDGRVSQSIRETAAEVARNADAMVLSSVGMDDYPGFESGRHGLYIVFPGGEPQVGGSPAWSFFRWYHPFDQRTLRAAFGNYDWCRDGATPGNGQVENWFELLDSWFDSPDETGGLNSYGW